ncbi:hypothetical protein [Marimonas lutisalis]|uniref:hypothetical protein n=1 Tax=Marimonas lutisalis TaxID=2545756 RepID=UPI0010F657AC|nr:hypothetical protein [Marimonas lutisalis]
MRILPAALILGTAFAAPGHAFTAVNGLTVNLVPDGFEVVSGVGSGPREFWCAAGQYARQMQGAGGNDRVYVLRAYGPSTTHPGRRAVAFTTQPSLDLANGPRLGTGGNYSVRIRAEGFNLRTAHAESFCADVYEIDIP